MKKKEPVQVALDDLWASFIDSYEFDLLNNRITFHVKLYETQEVARHFTVTFSGVSAFYYVYDLGQKRLQLREPEPGDRLEMTSVRYIGKSREHIDSLGTQGPLPSHPNFALEIWESWLLIEARAVTVNGVTFEVGYPSA